VNDLTTTRNFEKSKININTIKKNENVTKITIFSVKIVSDKNLRKTYEKITELKLKYISKTYSEP
jgi:hypothetical protein